MRDPGFLDTTGNSMSNLYRGAFPKGGGSPADGMGTGLGMEALMNPNYNPSVGFNFGQLSGPTRDAFYAAKGMKAPALNFGNFGGTSDMGMGGAGAGGINFTGLQTQVDSQGLRRRINLPPPVT